MDKETSGWIAVKDTLPRRIGDYLVAFDDGTVMSFDYTQLDIARGSWGYEGPTSSKVTHWMELPAPPIEVNRYDGEFSDEPQYDDSTFANHDGTFADND